MKRKLQALTIAMMIALVAAPAALAQYSSSKPEYARLDPYGPYQPIYHDWFQDPGGEPSGEDEEQAAEPDSNLLPVADSLKVATSEGHPNFVQPRFNFTQRADMNGSFGNPYGTSTFSGGVELFQRSRKTELSLEYAGGGSVNNNGGTGSSYHQLRLRESFHGRRWAVMMGNETAYLPEAPFSFVRTAGILISGTFQVDGVSHAFNNALLPVQSIITGQSNRWSTASVGQFQYRIGPRSSLVVASAYGILRFSNPELIDTSQTNIRVGYQGSLSGRNTLSISYGLGVYRFSNGISGVNNHSAQVSYQRTLTNRMALQVSGGPEIGSFHDIVAGDQTRLFWSFNGTVLYRLNRTNLGFSYSRRLDGGSGVLAGSQGDTVGVTLSRQLSRQWAMTLDGGYAHSSALRVFTLAPPPGSFDSQFGGIRFYRNLGRDRNLTLGYTMSHQNSTTPDCVGAGCQGGQLRHAFEIGFEWLPRPFRLD